MLRGFVDEKTLAQLTVKHPVSRYDLKYFPELDDGASSEREANSRASIPMRAGAQG